MFLRAFHSLTVPFTAMPVLYCDTQAKRRRQAMGSEAYNQLIRDMENTTLQPCEELVAKYSAFSAYN